MSRIGLSIVAMLAGLGCGTESALGGESESEAATAAETAAETHSAASSEVSTSESEASTEVGESETSTQSSGGEPDLPQPPAPQSLGCLMEPPEGALVPPQRPAYPGTCPDLVPGRNTISSFAVDREFELVLPTDLDPDKPLPLFVMWHWLGGDAQDFLGKGFIQEAADLWHFAAIVPEAKPDLVFKWPFTSLDTDLRIDEELAFFDAMVDCTTQQFNVNESCISTGGVSAGGLWSSVLASRRGVFLSSVVSLSGGTRGDDLTTEALRSWGGSPHKLPYFVLWGGPADFCIAIDFEKASLALEQGLEEDGHFVYECIHDCTHGEPPFDPPADTTQFFPMWRFMLDHPYWLQDGDSPYLHEGEPEGMPQWCAIGAGSATARDGECGPNQCM